MWCYNMNIPFFEINNTHFWACNNDIHMFRYVHAQRNSRSMRMRGRSLVVRSRIYNRIVGMGRGVWRWYWYARA